MTIDGSLHAICSLAGAFVLAFGPGSGGALAQDEPKKAGKGIEYWTASASKDEMALASDPEKPFRFGVEPALRWSNPLRKTDDGALFLWTDRGRPEVAASFWHSGSVDRPMIVHEFQSLSVSPLIGRHKGRTVWSPTAGITPTPIPGAPLPAADAAERLRQMRALARDFKAFLDAPTEKSELRSLTKPLYRYEIGGARSDVSDGALFGFVHTTDPEVLLLIESRVSAPGGPLVWHYACARMSGFTLRVEHKGQEVWQVDRVANFSDSTKPYWALGETPPAR